MMALHEVSRVELVVSGREKKKVVESIIQISGHSMDHSGLTKKMCCPVCKVELWMRVEVVRTESFTKVVKQARGEQGGSWVGKMKPEFNPKPEKLKFKI